MFPKLIQMSKCAYIRGAYIRGERRRRRAGCIRDVNWVTYFEGVYQGGGGLCTGDVLVRFYGIWLLFYCIYTIVAGCSLYVAVFSLTTTLAKITKYYCLKIGFKSNKIRHRLKLNSCCLTHLTKQTQEVNFPKLENRLTRFLFCKHLSC